MAAVTDGFARVAAFLSRNRLRIAFLVLIALSGVVVANGSNQTLSTATEADVPIAPETENHTVITESGRAGTITVYDPDGEVVYYNNTRTKYFDVDLVEGEDDVIEYTATDTVSGKSDTCTAPPCARNVIERVNLTTREVEVIYERYDYKDTAGEWHDSTRLNDTHVAVADIVEDQVFVVNTETEIVEWLWDAQSEFPVEEGGPYPEDWAHINDIEYIEEGEMAGRFMVSLRNQDQVVFLDPEEGLVEDWTLGSEDDYDTQYEQHNPDYIPESQGGPAIVVADSENARVQEFQREDGEWERSWEWSDDRIQWPRDADRLPNGNTLITDTHGKRVIEVDQEGEIVWQVDSTLPYEAERLETGAESEGGQSATELGLASRTGDDSGDSDGAAGVLSALNPFDALGDLIASVLPHRVYNGILYASPPWMGSTEFAAVTVMLVTGLVWIGLEARWQLYDRNIRFRLPFYRRRE